jgi:hypothetical protein
MKNIIKILLLVSIVSSFSLANSVKTHCINSCVDIKSDIENLLLKNIVNAHFLSKGDRGYSISSSAVSSLVALAQIDDRYMFEKCKRECDKFEEFYRFSFLVKSLITSYRDIEKNNGVIKDMFKMKGIEYDLKKEALFYKLFFQKYKKLIKNNNATLEALNKIASEILEYKL